MRVAIVLARPCVRHMRVAIVLARPCPAVTALCRARYDTKGVWTQHTSELKIMFAGPRPVITVFSQQGYQPVGLLHSCLSCILKVCAHKRQKRIDSRRPTQLHHQRLTHRIGMGTFVEPDRGQ